MWCLQLRPARFNIAGVAVGGVCSGYGLRARCVLLPKLAAICTPMPDTASEPSEEGKRAMTSCSLQFKCQDAERETYSQHVLLSGGKQIEPSGAVSTIE